VEQATFLEDSLEFILKGRKSATAAEVERFESLMTPFRLDQPDQSNRTPTKTTPSNYVKPILASTKPSAVKRSSTPPVRNAAVNKNPVRQTTPSTTPAAKTKPTATNPQHLPKLLLPALNRKTKRSHLPRRQNLHQTRGM